MDAADVTPLGVADRIRSDGTVCQWIAGDGTEYFVSNLLFRLVRSVHFGYALTTTYHDHLPSPTTTSHTHPYPTNTTNLHFR